MINRGFAVPKPLVPAILYPQWQPGHQRKGHKYNNNYPVSFIRVGQTLLQVAQCTIFVMWGQVYLWVVCFIAKHSGETQCHLLTIYIFFCFHVVTHFIIFSVMQPKSLFVVYLMISNIHFFCHTAINAKTQNR